VIKKAIWTVPPNVPESHPYWDCEDILWGPSLEERWYESSLTPEQRASLELDLLISHDNREALETLKIEGQL
jgi:hypothetical protein